MKRTVMLALLFALLLAIPANAALDEEQLEPVSYTHLTLPTKA